MSVSFLDQSQASGLKHGALPEHSVGCKRFTKLNERRRGKMPCWWQCDRMSLEESTREDVIAVVGHLQKTPSATVTRSPKIASHQRG